MSAPIVTERMRDMSLVPRRPMSDDGRRRSTPAMPIRGLEISPRAACRTTIAGSPPPTPRLARTRRRDSLAARLRSNSGLSQHVNAAALRQYTDYNPDGSPVRPDFGGGEWSAIDSLSGGGLDRPGNRASVASMPPLSWKHSNGSSPLIARPDLFAREVVQMVLQNPATSEMLLGFAESKRMAEELEFLQKLKEYTHCVNSVTSTMAAISTTYTSVAAATPIRLPQQVSRQLNADVKHVATAILPALETLFSDASAHVEQRVASDLFPAFVRHQLALATTSALGTEVRHSSAAGAFDRRFPGLADAYCLSDPLQLDNPVVFVSDGLVDLVGWDREELIGRNCRFLQGFSGGGAGTGHHQAATARLRAALQASSMAYPGVSATDRSANGGSGMLELVLNYRRDADGAMHPFWNLLFVCPLTTATGRVAYYLGGQVNISEAVGSYKEMLDILSLGRRPSSSSTVTTEAPRVVHPALNSPSAEGLSSPSPVDGMSSSSHSFSRTGQHRHLQKKPKKKNDDDSCGPSRSDRGRGEAGGGQDQQPEDQRTRRRSVTRGFSFKPFRRQRSFERTSVADSRGDPRVQSRNAALSPTPGSGTTRSPGLSAPPPWVTPLTSLPNGSPPLATTTETGGQSHPQSQGTSEPPVADLLGGYIRHMVLQYVAYVEDDGPEMSAGNSSAGRARMRVEFCSASALEILGIPLPPSPDMAVHSRVQHQDILGVLAYAAGSPSITRDFADNLLARMAEGQSTSTRITIGALSPHPAASPAPAPGLGHEPEWAVADGGGFPYAGARRRPATATATKKKPGIMTSIRVGRSDQQQQQQRPTTTTPGPPRKGETFERFSDWSGAAGAGPGAIALPSQEDRREREVVCHWTPLRNAQGRVRWVVLIIAPVTSD